MATSSRKSNAPVLPLTSKFHRSGSPSGRFGSRSSAFAAEVSSPFASSTSSSFYSSPSSSHVYSRPTSPTRVNLHGFAPVTSSAVRFSLASRWGPTFIGYSLQGIGKYGFYEVFKNYYSGVAGEEAARRYRQWIWLGASASAEFFADIMLCPFEALKIRMQTSLPPFAKTAREGFAKINAAEGLGGFYKGIGPLWARQIPYTMMKFASFEAIVEYIYSSYLPKPKSEYNKTQQLGVSFVGGYAAGVLCATVSHPADVLVSKLNNAARVEGESTGQVTLKLIKQLGFMGLWTGLGTRIIMIGTLTALQWGTYDSFKVFVGLPTTGH